MKGMKANEAPEKIYLQDSISTDTVEDLWPEWFDAKVSDNSIEYTRTDVFIEKACEWLVGNISKYVSAIKGTDVIAVDCKLFDDFRKFMEE